MATHPGLEIVDKIMRHTVTNKPIGAKKLAQKLGLSFMALQDVLNHKAPVTDVIAEALETNYPNVHAKAEWLQKQTDYNNNPE